MEFLFKKDELLALIQQSQSDKDQIAVDLTFKFGQQQGQFIADITARAKKKGAPPLTAEELETDPTVKGCPNPPGCF